MNKYGDGWGTIRYDDYKSYGRSHTTAITPETWTFRRGKYTQSFLTISGPWWEISENEDRGFTQNFDARLMRMVDWPAEPFWKTYVLVALCSPIRCRFLENDSKHGFGPKCSPRSKRSRLWNRFGLEWAEGPKIIVYNGKIYLNCVRGYLRWLQNCNLDGACHVLRLRWPRCTSVLYLGGI